MRKIPKMQKDVTPAQTNGQITNKADAPTQLTPLVKASAGTKTLIRKPAKNLQTPPKRRRSYTPDAVQSRVIARHVDGQSNREIAKKEGIDRGTVSRILAQVEVAVLMKRYHSQLLAMVPRAIAVYKQLLNSKDERVRAAAATKDTRGARGILPQGWPLVRANNAGTG